MRVSKRDLLSQKETRAYGCPNYIDPKFGKKILDALGVKATKGAVLLFTEVMENFGMSLLKTEKGKLTKKQVISAIRTLTLED